MGFTDLFRFPSPTDARNDRLGSGVLHSLLLADHIGHPLGSAFIPTIQYQFRGGALQQNPPIMLTVDFIDLRLGLGTENRSTTKLTRFG